MSNPQTTTCEKILLSVMGAIVGFFAGAIVGLFASWVGGGAIAIVFTPSNPVPILMAAVSIIPKICAVLGVLIGSLCPWIDE